MKKSVVMLFLTLALGQAALALAQRSLGDLARQLAAERSKAAKKPVRVYTNDDLPARPPEEGATAASGISGTPAGESSGEPSSGKPGEGQSATKPESAQDKNKTEEYWKGKFKAARVPLADAQEEQQLVEDELNLLQIQLAREVNPTTQDELGTKIKAKQTDLEAKRAVTNKAQKALDDLEKEFKDSGAPEDWSKTE